MKIYALCLAIMAGSAINGCASSPPQQTLPDTSHIKSSADSLNAKVTEFSQGSNVITADSIKQHAANLQADIVAFNKAIAPLANIAAKAADIAAAATGNPEAIPAIDLANAAIQSANQVTATLK
jgi:hypothetical protein